MKGNLSSALSKTLSKNNLIITIVLYALSILVAVVLPPILWQLDISVIARTYNGNAPGMLDSQPFELFGLFISAILVVAAWQSIRHKEKNLSNLAFVFLPLFVSLQILFFLIEDSHPKSGDYLCYETAAQAIVSGINPYSVYLRCYLYPPLQAQVFALLHQFVTWGLLLNPTDSERAWTIVFYFYQCGQFLQILLAYYLTYQLARKVRLEAIPACLIVSALFLFNNPLVRTIKFNQINIWILNCFLLTILWLPRHPFFSGLAVALGAHIKLYTLTLLLPWTLSKQWRPILGVFVCFSAILLWQTDFGQNWEVWQQFLQYFTERVEKPSHYRNSGFWSLIYNLAKIPNNLTNSEIFFSFVPIAVVVLNLLFIAWFALRVLKREKAYSELVESDSSHGSEWSSIYRHYGHAIDSVALGLLISPSVWEHHYVLAIPVALWAIITRRDRPWLVGAGIFLIFCLPTFDVFLLGHHRMLGLLTLIYATSPNFVKPYFLKSKDSYSLNLI